MFYVGTALPLYTIIVIVYVYPGLSAKHSLKRFIGKSHSLKRHLAEKQSDCSTVSLYECVLPLVLTYVLGL